MDVIRTNPINTYTEVMEAIDILTKKYDEHKLNIDIQVVNQLYCYVLELRPYEQKRDMQQRDNRGDR